ncbi:hypothetical protein A3D06_00295 [Candidatus Roizmanbacteria bacterium RIFCSPHIGHO2_02_FULL_40_9]|uniref:Cohesin domain-containing protein n=1 Tax=Candidatus Roizmanbacteria bacterium RIFCSPHIGHO2_02_FULL_40_9 TaxID=1802042 RepID=A0A1F7HEJ9_9BACT|nr:MAG: hypothetical protein A3D06_00295 [Candidatus Roizmanbacteria bacterium RIFCSPHIGHO2_02_FULL_40_9]
MTGFLDTVSHDVQDFKNLNSRSRNIFIVQILVLMTVSIIVGMLLSPKFKTTQNQNQVALQNNPKGTILEISPRDHIMKVGEEIDLEINLKGDRPTAMDIALSYDPTAINVESVLNGEVFDREIINKIEKGKIMFSAAQSPGENKGKNSSRIVTVKIKALKKIQETKISFIENQTIAAKSGENILSKAQEAIIHIFD